MATPLYKRYIPPKPSAVGASKLEPVPRAAQNSTSNGEPTKRKRERTEEEVAERKAKKLRKKGVESAKSITEAAPSTNEDTTGLKDLTIGPDRSKLENIIKEPGDFAHIKSSRKRHKLEKEARKARKAASREAKKGITSNGRDEDDPGTEYSNTPADGGNTLNVSNGNIAPSHGHETARPSEQTWTKASSENEGDVAVPKTKRKDRKKAKGGEETNGQHEAEDALPEHEYDETLSQPKKRRHKLEHVLTQAEEHTDNQPNDDREHLQKHKGILKKFQRATELSTTVPQETAIPTEQLGTSQPVILDLVPLPQPEQPAPTEFKLDPASLPSWLAKPYVISSESQSSFADIGLDPKLVERLSGFGFDDALPVQQALIPLLMPPGSPGARFLSGSETVLPDIAVSAPTGSGKTIAYLLPMIESARNTVHSGNLKALVVVPTRELVMQVAAVAESLAKSTGMKIGMATGTGNFRDEQSKLIQRGRRYDPEGYRELMTKAHHRNYPQSEDSEDFYQYLEILEKEDAKEEKHIHDAIACLVNHVPTYDSAVDILFATPGRLLEHLNGTLGFSLAHLEWLVLDEADKLLDQQYDGFLDAINKELTRPRILGEQDARERYLRSQKAWSEQTERLVRKVVLSATMTRDVSKLVGLKLRRPQMVVVRGKEQDSTTPMNGSEAVDHDVTAGAKESESAFELPPTLSEYSVHVGDGAEKPVFLVELLRTRIISQMHRYGLSAQKLNAESSDADSTDQDTDTSSDSDSEEDSDSGSSSTDSSESSEQESDDDVAADTQKNLHIQATEYQAENEMAIHPDRAAMLDRLSLGEKHPKAVPTILIFTSSTESANRLAHLLRNVQPEWASWVSTMTRTDGKGKPSIKSKVEEPAIVISTDRAGRGLDAIGNRTISHVVQYDVPRSVTNYVHRVGRTARAGKRGEAWTLFTHSEARWFINSVVKAKNIKRAEPVERVKVVVEDDGLRERLRKVVAEMRDEVLGGGGHRRSR